MGSSSVSAIRAAQVLDRWPNANSAIALTFDDGPSEWTEPILETLADSEVHATFFVIGELVEAGEAILRRTADAGHEIGNHAYLHRRLDDPRLRRTEVRDELLVTSEAIRAVLGRNPTVFRPPGFGCNATVCEAACDCGFEWVVQASTWTDDYNAEDPEAITKAILNHDNLTPGAIIDLHDGRPPREPPWGTPGGTRNDRRATVEATRAIVPELVERGYQLLTVSELLAL